MEVVVVTKDAVAEVGAEEHAVAAAGDVMVDVMVDETEDAVVDVVDVVDEAVDPGGAEAEGEEEPTIKILHRKANLTTYATNQKCYFKIKCLFFYYCTGECPLANHALFGMVIKR